jgi:hydrogenase maturation protease
MSPLLVILGYGNPSRGDDALGPALMERVERWIHLHPQARVEAVEDFQLQVEHALDLVDRDLALFLDAKEGGEAAVTLSPVLPSADASFTTHAISPSAVLHAFREVQRRDPPPSFVLGVRGRSFELGEDLSPEARQNLESAWGLLERLLEEPTAAAWTALCTKGD